MVFLCAWLQRGTEAAVKASRWSPERMQIPLEERRDARRWFRTLGARAERFLAKERELRADEVDSEPEVCP